MAPTSEKDAQNSFPKLILFLLLITYFLAPYRRYAIQKIPLRLANPAHNVPSIYILHVPGGHSFLLVTLVSPQPQTLLDPQKTS